MRIEGSVLLDEAVDFFFSEKSAAQEALSAPTDDRPSWRRHRLERRCAVIACIEAGLSATSHAFRLLISTISQQERVRRRRRSLNDRAVAEPLSIRHG